MTGDQTLLGGGGRLTDTDGEEAKGKIKRDRKRANYRGQRTRVNLGGGEKGRGGPEPSSDGNNSKLN